MGFGSLQGWFILVHCLAGFFGVYGAERLVACCMFTDTDCLIPGQDANRGLKWLLSGKIGMQGSALCRASDFTIFRKKLSVLFARNFDSHV
jgi:hypothetical protein